MLCRSVGQGMACSWMVRVTVRSLSGRLCAVGSFIFIVDCPNDIDGGTNGIACSVDRVGYCIFVINLGMVWSLSGRVLCVVRSFIFECPSIQWMMM